MAECSIPRHCTCCGGRIWSLARVAIHDRLNASRWQDHCNDCATDDEDTDPWQFAVTGRRSTRRSSR